MGVFGGDMGCTSLVESRPCSIWQDAAVPARSGGATAPETHWCGLLPVESADRAAVGAC